MCAATQSTFEERCVGGEGSAVLGVVVGVATVLLVMLGAGRAVGVSM